MSNISSGRLRRIITAPFSFAGRLIQKLTPKKNASQGKRTSELDQKLILNLRRKKIPNWKQFKYLEKVLSKNEKIILGAATLVFLAAIITIGLAFYFEHRVFVPEQGGEYTEGLIGSPQFINPIYAPSNDVDTDIARLVYSGLMRVTPEGILEPDLAESYEIVDEGKKYVFHLRGDARWHDGSQVTADDVTFTFDSIQDPALGSPWAATFRSIIVEKVDDLTVQFTLEDPFSPFLSTLVVGILPQHLWQDVPTSGFQIAEFNKKPIGSGPYKFKSFIRDKKGMIHSFALERNDKYYGKPPYIDEITFKFYPTFEEGVNALNNKNIQGLSYLPRDQKEKIRGRGDMVYHTPAMPQYTSLFFNQKKRSELKEFDVRQALALATDKEAIAREALNGQAKVVHAPIPEGYIGYHPEIEKYELNIEQANELLNETKWKFLDENDTYRAMMVEKEDEEGETYEERRDFTLSISTIDTRENIAVAEAIAEQWQRVGIKVEIRPYSSAELQREVIKNQNYEILLFGEVLGIDPDPYPFWHSSQIGVGLNLALLANRDVDKLLEDARTSTDEDVRQEKYQEFQDILAEKLPAIFLYSPTYTYPVTDKVKGIKIERMTMPADRFSGIVDWYIETKRAWE